MHSHVPAAVAKANRQHLAAEGAHMRVFEPLPRILRIFWAGSAAAFALMFLLAWLAWRAGVARENWDPLSDTLYNDLFQNMPTFTLLHTAAFWQNSDPLTPVVGYPPFAAVLMGLLYASGSPAAIYTAIAAGGLLLAGWYVRAALIDLHIHPFTATIFPPTIFLFSFPVEALLQKGNIELFLWMFAAGGIWAFLRGHEYAAAILWALAASEKLYPAIFFVLFLPRRQYRAVGLGMLTAAAVSLGSMAYLGPTLKAAALGSLRSISGYQGKRVGEWNMFELAENHSFFTLVKTLAMISHHSADRLPPTYYACGAVVFLLLFFGRLHKMPIANQLLGVSAFMLLLPPISYSHTLVHLYAPWVVLVLLVIRAERAQVRIPGLVLTVLVFLPLFSCFTLMNFKSFLLFGGLVQSACLVELLFCAAAFSFAEPPLVVA